MAGTVGFTRRGSSRGIVSIRGTSFNSILNQDELKRYSDINLKWNFYEGYHWEDIPSSGDSPEITLNYCRTFVDKFVAFELGEGFTFTTSRVLSNAVVTSDGRTLFQYLEDVWEDNNQYQFISELGQMKSVTGEAWVQVAFKTPEELENEDPYNEYPDGRLVVMLMPTDTIFPTYNPHNRKVLDSLTVMYEYTRTVNSGILNQPREQVVTYRQVWTREECHIYDGGEETVIPNKYGVIPFIQINNLSVAGKSEGRGDLDDLIPMNTEFNMKMSNVSEIIDYHAAPVTVVYGAKIGALEKGANKLWGGLSKDSKVENLELKSDLAVSSNYLSTLKLAMCEVGGIPESVLGGAKAISNTSGVALQYINLPLVEKTRLKRQNTEDGLERLNKLIILVSLLNGLISKPENVEVTSITEGERETSTVVLSNRDFYHTEVSLPDTLPKDMLIELQQISMEFGMALESREGALTRLGRENIEDVLAKIDAERAEHPEIFNALQNGGEESPQINSGMLNGQTPDEVARVATTGSNGNA